MGRGTRVCGLHQGLLTVALWPALLVKEPLPYLCLRGDVRVLV